MRKVWPAAILVTLMIVVALLVGLVVKFGRQQPPTPGTPATASTEASRPAAHAEAEPTAGAVGRKAPVPVAAAAVAAPAAPVMKQPQAVPVEAKPKAAPAAAIPIVWVVKDDRGFNQNNCNAQGLAPWYDAQTDGLGEVFPPTPPGEADAPPGIPALALMGTAEKPEYFRLTSRVPHRLRWTVSLRFPFPERLVFRYSAAGVQLIPPADPDQAWLERNRTYTVSAERSGGTLVWTLNGKKVEEFTVPEDDRSILGVESPHESRNAFLLSSRLEFAAGEGLSDPVAPRLQAAEAAAPIAWKTAFEDHFEKREAIQKYTCVDGGKLDWNATYQALLLANDPAGDGQIYCAVPQSLPGDLRVQLRVLRPKGAQDINIGIVFNIKGSLHGEEGYYAEIKNGRAQIKRFDILQASGAAPTPATDDRWIRVELVKTGGRIDLLEEGKPVLHWIDPHPVTDAAHDLLSLYVWSDQQLVDDLVIERNPADPVKPLEDNPADPQNAVDGKRDPAAHAAQDQF